MKAEILALAGISIGIYAINQHSWGYAFGAASFLIWAFFIVAPKKEGK